MRKTKIQWNNSKVYLWFNQLISQVINPRYNPKTNTDSIFFVYQQNPPIYLSSNLFKF